MAESWSVRPGDDGGDEKPAVEQAEGQKRSDDVEAAGIEAGLLPCFTQCRVDGSSIAGIRRATREDELARIVRQVRGASGEQHVWPARPVGDDHQYRGGAQGDGGGCRRGRRCCQRPQPGEPERGWAVGTATASVAALSAWSDSRVRQPTCPTPHSQKGEADTFVGCLHEPRLPGEPRVAEERAGRLLAVVGVVGVGPVGGIVSYGDKGLSRADQLGDGTTERGERFAHRRGQHQVRAGFGEGVYRVRVEQVATHGDHEVPTVGRDVDPELRPSERRDVLDDGPVRGGVLVVDERRRVAADPRQRPIGAAGLARWGRRGGSSRLPVAAPGRAGGPTARARRRAPRSRIARGAL